jgi:hypothetical protein
MKQKLGLPAWAVPGRDVLIVRSQSGTVSVREGKISRVTPASAFVKEGSQVYETRYMPVMDFVNKNVILEEYGHSGSWSYHRAEVIDRETPEGRRLAAVAAREILTRRTVLKANEFIKKPTRQAAEDLSRQLAIYIKEA